MAGASLAGRLLKGLGALVLLAALLVGLPLALWTVAGNPLPDSLPSWNQVVSTLTHPDLTGSMLVGTVKIVAWIGWATFALAVLVEIPAALRGVPAPRLRGIGLQQRAAAVLVIAVITMGSTGVAGLAPSAQAAELPSAPPVASVTATASAMVPLVPGQGGMVDDQAIVAQLVSTTPQAVDQAHTVDRADDKAEKADAAELATYEVQRGDNLWAIAQDKLGDGNRYTEIVDLNVGVQQADGYALEPGSDWIEPGWVLTLPIPVEKAAATVAGDVEHVVTPGESLSSIAKDHLGDADRYPELFEASRDTVQPDGDRLSDPALIRPGWVITVPGADVAAETAGEAPVEAAVVPASNDTPSVPDIDVPTLEAPAPVERLHPAVAIIPGFGAQSTDTSASGAGITEAGPVGAEAPVALGAAQSADADQGDAADDGAFDVRTAAGIGGLLASGLLGLLAGRRIEARRRRRAGERVPLPVVGSAAGTFESEVRAVADPLGREQVDVALRALGAWYRAQGRALPEVRLARLATESFDLYLDQPADLPAPWESTADRQVWRLGAENLDAVAFRSAASGEAPWPALVTIGHDDEDAHVLLDLERAGCLDIRGDQEIGRAALAALAVELATSVWADDLQVTLVGAHAGLPGVVDTGRVRHVAALESILRELEARAADVRTALTQLRADSLGDARGRGLAADAWTPEILLVGEHLDDAVRARLEQLVEQVPGVGIAAVTAGNRRGEWTLDLTDGMAGRGVLYPAQLAVRPQQLDPASYAAAVALLARAEPQPGPAWAQSLPDVEVPLSEIPVPLVAPVEDEDDDAPTMARVRSLRPPLLRVLGPVRLEVASGIELPPGEQQHATELVAYLTFHPGANEADIRSALWPARHHTTKAQRALVSQARRWLGVDAAGQEHLPRSAAWQGAAPTDGDAGRYHLRGVDSDWGRFLELVGDDIALTHTTRLVAALDLVHGSAFQGVPTRRYGWAQGLVEELTASVVDVAHEVARRSLLSGELRTARYAAAVGRSADLLDERPWRDAIRTEWADGRTADVEELIEAMSDRVEGAGLVLQRETEDLIEQVRQAAGSQRPGQQLRGG